MSALERSLGLQLFERQARRISPTEAAQYLCDRSGDLLDLVSQLEADAGRLAAGQAGRLRIGSFASAGRPIMAPAIARFLTRRRDVELSLDEGEPHELFPEILEGELDVALGFRYDLVPTDWPYDVRVTDLLIEHLRVIAPRRHRLASKERVELGELKHERWIANREDTAASTCLRALCDREGFAPHIAFRSNSFGTVRGFVAAGLGVALIPAMAHEPDDDIVSLTISTRLPRREVVVATRRIDSNPLVRVFLTSLRRAADGLSVQQEP